MADFVNSVKTHISSQSEISDFHESQVRHVSKNIHVPKYDKSKLLKGFKNSQNS